MNENSESHSTRVHAGRHLDFHSRRGWEFVARSIGTGVVGVIAITDNDELVLVEQFRIPVSSRVLELPAGLVGDLAEETIEAAARRELLEETGFTAVSLVPLFKGPTSAGLTSEVIHILQARGVTRSGKGGGIGGESITVHVVPLCSLDSFISDFEAEGGLVDFNRLDA